MRSTVPNHRVSIVLLLAALVLGLTAAAGAQSLPSFSKSFVPDTIGPGSVSTLTFNISNSGSGVRELAFTDNLPAGMTIASPAKAFTNCFSASLSAPAGGTTIDLSGGDLPGGNSCFVTVDVTAAATATNVSGDLTSTAGNSGSASATLTVDNGRPGFTKSFSPNLVFLGDRSRLTFTVDNSANPVGAILLSFTDTLPAGMTVASPANVAKTCTGGTVTATAGGNLVSYSGNLPPFAQVAANSTCTIGVDVVTSAIGALGNTSGELTSQPANGGFLRSSGKAAAVLDVTVAQIALTKEFVDDPAAPGGTVTLRFTVRNLDRRDAATAISFTDDLDAVLSGLEAVGLPAGRCGGTLGGTGFLTFSGGSLGIEESCTFDVTLSVPAGAGSGSYANTTSSITADVAGDSVVGDPASDVLFVDAVPVLTKTFLGDPVGAGDTIELEFTITNSSSTSEATDITFEDVFVEEIQTASFVPANGFCGPSSTATFTPLINPPAPSDAIPARLVVAGASLDPGASCTFSVILDIFFAAQTNTYPNTTSSITATLDGDTVTGNPASDSFDLVAPPALIKAFVDDPAAPGGTVTLAFTLAHDENAPGDATGITFTDDLSATLSGLTATGLPMTDVCGIGSEIDGTSQLTLTGGNLQPGESCTVSVTLDVPAGAVPGSYPNTTSTVVADILGVSATGPPGTDDLDIAGLTLTKEFTDDPVIAGGTVTLEFVLANNSPDFDATDVLFTDDLHAAVPNMTVTSLPTEPCGTGSSIVGLSGNRLLRFAADLLPAGASCTFSVTLLVPAGTASDTYVNRTALLSAVFDGSVTSFENATDELVVSSDFLLLEKEFLDDPASPGDLVTLQFLLTNLSDTQAVSGIAFTDDLGAALSGLAAVGTPFAACGGTVSGTSVISFSGGSLAAAASCTFNVTVQVPLTAPLGTQAANVTSTVTGTAGGLGVVGDPATDELRIDYLVFSKAFDGPAEAGGTVVLTFTLENLDEADFDPELNFVDDLDAVIPGLTAIDTPLFDLCGEGSSLEGTSLLLFDNGVLPPGGSCTFSVTLQVPAGAAPGGYLNVTSDLLQGSAAAAAPATAVLTVIENADDDDDGVLNGDDVCADTVIPEAVPTQRLGVNRFALVDADLVFDTTPPNGNGPGETFTTTDTAGCSCEQIIEELDLGNGHTKFGCSLGAMREWVESVSAAARDLQLYRWILDRSDKFSLPAP